MGPQLRPQINYIPGLLRKAFDIFPELIDIPAGHVMNWEEEDLSSPLAD
jgi:hypothetical protein